MKSEFEEKQFESPLNAELANSAGGLFMPTGQVLESLVGFDAAILTHDIRFWSLFRHPHPLGGVLIDPLWWELAEADINALPQFQFNLFLQHKRPEYCKGPRGKHRNYFGGPYYRFGITSHQQLALERLAAGASGSAIVSYACPALHTMSALFSHIQARTLVAATNFVEVSKLSGHKFYNYQAGGAQGLANNEPKIIEGSPITVRIEEMRRSHERYPTNSAFIKTTARLVESIGREARIIGRVYSKILDSSRDVRRPNETAEAVFKIQTFTYLTGCSWSIAAQK